MASRPSSRDILPDNEDTTTTVTPSTIPPLSPSVRLEAEGAWEVVHTLDTFAKAKITNFIQRMQREEKKEEEERTSSTASKPGGAGSSLIPLETRFMASSSYYYSRVILPIPRTYQSPPPPASSSTTDFPYLYAEGCAPTAKDAELAACMHAERLVDACGYPLFQLSSKQKRHAEAAAAAGRWAPLPPSSSSGDGGSPNSATPLDPEVVRQRGPLPAPIQYVPPGCRGLAPLGGTGSGGGAGLASSVAAAGAAAAAAALIAKVEQQLRVDKLHFASVRRGVFTPLKYTLASPYFFDAGSVFRIKQFLQAYKVHRLNRACWVTAVHKEVLKLLPREGGGVGFGASKRRGHSGSAPTKRMMEEEEDEWWEDGDTSSGEGGVGPRALHGCGRDEERGQGEADHSRFPPLFIAQLRLPIDARFGERICVGKATTRREAVTLACMHAELTIDNLGLMLYPHSPEDQRQHAVECRQVQRWCAEPGEFNFRYTTPSPPALALESDREVSAMSDSILRPQMFTTTETHPTVPSSSSSSSSSTAATTPHTPSPTASGAVDHHHRTTTITGCGDIHRVESSSSSSLFSSSPTSSVATAEVVAEHPYPSSSTTTASSSTEKGSPPPASTGSTEGHAAKDSTSAAVTAASFAVMTSIETIMVQHSRAVNNIHGVLNVSTMEPSARKYLKAYLARCYGPLLSLSPSLRGGPCGEEEEEPMQDAEERGRRGKLIEEPFLVEVLGQRLNQTYRATVSVPLWQVATKKDTTATASPSLQKEEKEGEEKKNESCGPLVLSRESFVAIGISDNREDAETAAAMHALHTLSVLNQPWFIPDTPVGEGRGGAFAVPPSPSTGVETSPTDTNASSLSSSSSSLAFPPSLMAYAKIAGWPVYQSTLPPRVPADVGGDDRLPAPVRCLGAHVGRISAPGLAADWRRRGQRLTRASGHYFVEMEDRASEKISQEGNMIKEILQYRKKLQELDWNIAPDVPALLHRVLVSPDASATGRNYVHTLTGVRQPDLFAVQRLKDYLERHGKNVDSSLSVGQTLAEEGGRGGGMEARLMELMEAEKGSDVMGEGDTTGKPYRGGGWNTFRTILKATHPLTVIGSTLFSENASTTTSNNHTDEKTLMVDASLSYVLSFSRSPAPPSSLWVVKVQLPLPLKLHSSSILGPLPRCIAVGESYHSQQDALCMCAMHAELLLDTLGIPFYDHPLLQRKHADTARILGRWAPLQYGLRPPLAVLNSSYLPPPVRREHPHSFVWQLVKQCRRKKEELPTLSQGSRRVHAVASSCVISAEGTSPLSSSPTTPTSPAPPPPPAEGTPATTPPSSSSSTSATLEAKDRKAAAGLRNTAEALKCLQRAAAASAVRVETAKEREGRGTGWKKEGDRDPTATTSRGASFSREGDANRTASPGPTADPSSSSSPSSSTVPGYRAPVFSSARSTPESKRTPAYPASTPSFPSSLSSTGVARSSRTLEEEDGSPSSSSTRIHHPATPLSDAPHLHERGSVDAAAHTEESVKVIEEEEKERSEKCGRPLEKETLSTPTEGSSTPRVDMTDLTDEELCDISTLQAVHPRELFRQAFKHVQFYFNTKGSDFQRTLRTYTVRDERHGIVHRAVVDIPLPEGGGGSYGRRVGVGCAAVKKLAPLLCACHVAWTLDTLGIPIYRGRRQHLYATLAKEAGRHAPFPGDPPAPFNTPSPKGLCCLSSVVREMPDPPPPAPTTEELQRDRRLWMQYVRAVRTYLEKKKEYDVYEAIFELKHAPRSGIPAEDDTLAAVELLPLQRQARSQLPPLCRAAGLPPPELFRYEPYGKLPQRMFLTEAPVLGTPFTARGLALSGPDSIQRAAMHYAYIITHVVMQNSARTQLDSSTTGGGSGSRRHGSGFGNPITSATPSGARPSPLSRPFSVPRSGALDGVSSPTVLGSGSLSGSWRRSWSPLVDPMKGDFNTRGKYTMVHLFAAMQPPFRPLQWIVKVKTKPDVGAGGAGGPASLPDHQGSVRVIHTATVEWTDAAEVRHVGKGDCRRSSSSSSSSSTPAAVAGVAGSSISLSTDEEATQVAKDAALADLHAQLLRHPAYQALLAFARRRFDVKLDVLFTIAWRGQPNPSFEGHQSGGGGQDTEASASLSIRTPTTRNVTPVSSVVASKVEKPPFYRLATLAEQSWEQKGGVVASPEETRAVPGSRSTTAATPSSSSSSVPLSTMEAEDKAGWGGILTGSAYTLPIRWRRPPAAAAGDDVEVETVSSPMTATSSSASTSITPSLWLQSGASTPLMEALWVACEVRLAFERRREEKRKGKTATTVASSFSSSSYASPPPAILFRMGLLMSWKDTEDGALEKGQAQGSGEEKPKETSTPSQVNGAPSHSGTASSEVSPQGQKESFIATNLGLCVGYLLQCFSPPRTPTPSDFSGEEELEAEEEGEEDGMVEDSSGRMNLASPSVCESTPSPSGSSRKKRSPGKPSHICFRHGALLPFQLSKLLIAGYIWGNSEDVIQFIDFLMNAGGHISPAQKRSTVHHTATTKRMAEEEEEEDANEVMNHEEEGKEEIDVVTLWLEYEKLQHHSMEETATTPSTRTPHCTPEAAVSSSVSWYGQELRRQLHTLHLQLLCSFPLHEPVKGALLEMLACMAAVPGKSNPTVNATHTHATSSPPAPSQAAQQDHRPTGATFEEEKALKMRACVAFATLPHITSPFVTASRTTPIIEEADLSSSTQGTAQVSVVLDAELHRLTSGEIGISRRWLLTSAIPFSLFLLTATNSTTSTPMIEVLEDLPELAVVMDQLLLLLPPLPVGAGTAACHGQAAVSSTTTPDWISSLQRIHVKLSHCYQQLRPLPTMVQASLLSFPILEKKENEEEAAQQVHPDQTWRQQKGVAATSSSSTSPSSPPTHTTLRFVAKSILPSPSAM